MDLDEIRDRYVREHFQAEEAFILYEMKLLGIEHWKPHQMRDAGFLLEKSFYGSMRLVRELDRDINLQLCNY